MVHELKHYVLQKTDKYVADKFNSLTSAIHHNVAFPDFSLFLAFELSLSLSRRITIRHLFVKYYFFIPFPL